MEPVAGYMRVSTSYHNHKFIKMKCAFLYSFNVRVRYTDRSVFKVRVHVRLRFKITF